MQRRMLQLVLVLGFFACLVSLPLTGWAAPAKGRFQLRVSLYPWIPNPTSFFQWIEADFEAKHPDIDLVVRPLAKSFGLADLAYEPDQTAAALTDESNPDFQHLVELDTLILGALAQRGATVPFAVENVRFLHSGSSRRSNVEQPDRGRAALDVWLFRDFRGPHHPHRDQRL